MFKSGTFSNHKEGDPSVLDLVWHKGNFGDYRLYRVRSFPEIELFDFDWKASKGKVPLSEVARK